MLKSKHLIFITLLTSAFSLACFIDRQPTLYPKLQNNNSWLDIFSDLSLRQADVYFHGGRYPSLFERTFLNQTDPCQEKQKTSLNFDFIEKINTYRKPKHIHLDAGENGAAKEIMPWLAFAQKTNPNDEETILLISYWLRRLNKPEEALKVVIKGIANNPNSAALYDELGWIKKSKKDLLKALNLWQKIESKKQKPNTLLLKGITAHLKEPLLF